MSMNAVDWEGPADLIGDPLWADLWQALQRHALHTAQALLPFICPTSQHSLAWRWAAQQDQVLIARWLAPYSDVAHTVEWVHYTHTQATGMTPFGVLDRLCAYLDEPDYLRWQTHLGHDRLPYSRALRQAWELETKVDQFHHDPDPLKLFNRDRL